MYDLYNIKAFNTYSKENSRPENQKDSSEAPEQIIQLAYVLCNAVQYKTSAPIVKCMVQGISLPADCRLSQGNSHKAGF